jgi:hypothetical protein
MATSCGFESHRPHQPSLASERRLPRRSPKGEGGPVATSYGLASRCPDGLRVAQPRKAVRVKRVRRSLSEVKAKTDCSTRGAATRLGVLVLTIMGGVLIGEDDNFLGLFVGSVVNQIAVAPRH